MNFDDVVQTWAAVRSTRSRIKKISALSTTLKAAGGDLPVVATWLSGNLSQGRIGIGYRMLKACQDQATEPAASASVTVTEVDRVFTQISKESGKGSVGRKLVYLSRLHARCTAHERLFLLELLSGEVRQGAQEGVLAEAIAIGTEVPLDRVRRAFMLSGDLAGVARTAFHDGVSGLEAYRMKPGVPVRPMLAQTAESAGQALVLLGGEAWMDAKLDGVRVQIHRDGDQVGVFTRNLHNVTAMVPEVVATALSLPWQRCVLDAEAIALDENRAPRPFQITMRRFGRRQNVEEMRKVLPLTTVVFDALLIGDEELIDLPASERFARLTELGRLCVPRILLSDADAAEQFYAKVLAAGHEGVMAKSPQGLYQAGARGKAWLKIKPAHTLDLLVIAAEWGSGRRQGWLSNLHLGALDADGEVIMLGKTFKGLTDKTLAWQTERLQQLETHRDGHVVYVKPELVVEIAFNDVQRSPHYPGGIALRFARVKRYRPDREPLDSDSFETVADLLPEGL